MSNRSNRNKPSRGKADSTPSPKPPPSQESAQERREIVFSGYAGELPSPQTLREFSEVVPDLPERLLQRLEVESAHRQRLEAELVGEEVQQGRDQAKERQRGQLFAFVVAVMGIVAGGATAAFSSTPTGAAVGGVIGGVPLVGMVTAFIAGRAVRPSRPTATPPDD